MTSEALTRLWVILAREAPVAAVFRRGPSRHVRLIKWNLDSDTFECGQWFKGRIYERRCDLSPSGSLLIYFAATYKEPLQSWTAVSKLPWFTALALWPKGDGWNGGGWFTGPHDIHLDHAPGEDGPHPDFAAACRKLRIGSLAQWRGEDAPVWHTTLRRGGWELAAKGEWSEYGEEQGFSWKARSPEVWRRPQVRTAYKALFTVESGFLKAVESDTAGAPNTSARLKILGDTISKIAGQKYAAPEIPVASAVVKTTAKKKR